MAPLTIVVLALATLAIIRQFRARVVRPRALVLVPLVLFVLGLPTIAHRPPVGDIGAGLLAANALVALVLGLARGRSERVWFVDTAAWRQGTGLTAVLWVGSIVLRGLAAVAARALGDTSAATSQLELLLGISFAAQHTVIAARAGFVPAWLRPAGDIDRLPPPHAAPPPGARR